MSETDLQYVAKALRRLDSLGDKMAEAIVLLNEYASIRELLEDITVEFPRQIDDLRDGVIHILKVLEEQPSKSSLDTGQLIEHLERDDRDSKKRQLLRLHQTLNMLDEEAARRGPDLDITLTTQIIKTKEGIQKLEREILEGD